MSDCTAKSEMEVVAGVIRYGGRILLARRAPGKHLAGYWEFPGGKIEAGETLEQTLVREMWEEFSLVVTVGKYIGAETYSYEDRLVELHAVSATAKAECGPGDSHDAVAWIIPADLPKYEIAPADAFIVSFLLTDAPN